MIKTFIALIELGLIIFVTWLMLSITFNMINQYNQMTGSLMNTLNKYEKKISDFENLKEDFNQEMDELLDFSLIPKG